MIEIDGMFFNYPIRGLNDWKNWNVDIYYFE